MRVSNIQTYNQHNVQQNKAQVQNNKNVSFGQMSAKTKENLIEIGEADLDSIDCLEKSPIFQVDYNEDRDVVTAKVREEAMDTDKRHILEYMLNSVGITVHYINAFLRWSDLTELAHLSRNIENAKPNTPIKEIYSDYYEAQEQAEIEKRTPKPIEYEDPSKRRTTALEDMKDSFY